MVDTLSPSMVTRFNREPIDENLAAKIAAMKRGMPETQSGFRRLTLALRVEPGDSPRPARNLMARNRAAAIYAVTLAESLTKNGRNYGRDFVFKALLRSDKDDPIPFDLYHRLPADRPHDPAAVEDAVNAQKLKIIDEFQMGAALMQASRVMQVFEMVQIGEEFGILCEKIDGENVRTLVPKAARAIEDGIISGPEYLDLSRQALMDVLIGIARCTDEGVAHSDISHNNVMYDKKAKLFKLIDMGSGRETGQQKPPGTAGYIDMRTAVGNEKSDIYAAGQLLAHFVRDRAAAPALTGFGVRQLTPDRFLFMEDLADIAPDDKLEILNVIRRMTQVEPTARPSAAEMLRDPFFEKCASRAQVHQCYEKLDQWEKSRQISARFTQCYPQIENGQDRDSIYGMVLDLNEAWQDEQQDRQGDIKTMLNRLHSRSIQQVLKIAEDRQLESTLGAGNLP
ncbi:hypothetical protein GS910_33605 [Paraburkholderia sp. RL16-012-BIC-B]|nr:hypothetical protein [Paraburkholderia madseniana]